MDNTKDPLGILGSEESQVKNDPLGILNDSDVKKKEQTEPTQAAPLQGLGGVSEEPTPSPSVGQGVLRDVDQTQPKYFQDLLTEREKRKRKSPQEEELLMAQKNAEADFYLAEKNNNVISSKIESISNTINSEISKKQDELQRAINEGKDVDEANKELEDFVGSMNDKFSELVDSDEEIQQERKNIESQINKELEGKMSDIHKRHYKEQDFFTGEFGAALRAMDSVTPLGIGDVIDDFGRAVLGTGRAQAEGAETGFDMLFSGAKASDEQINAMLNASKRMEEQGPSQEMFDYQNTYEEYKEKGEPVMGVIMGLVENPTVAPEVMLSSISGMVNEKSALAGGVILASGTATGATGGTFIAPGIGTGAGAVSGFMTSLPYAMAAAGTTMETGLSYAEFLREEIESLNEEEGTNYKYDLEGVRAILNNEERLANVQRRTALRGGSIALIDFLTARMATGLGSKLLKRGASRVGTTIGTSAVEGVGGSLGEFTAMKLSGQEVDVSEVALEGVGEGPSGVVAAVTEMVKTPTYKVNGESVSKEFVDELIKTSDPVELSAADIKINNDEKRSSQLEEKKKDAEILESIDESIQGENRQKIFELEKERQKIEGKKIKLQSNKKRLSEINSEIDAIVESQKDTVPAKQKGRLTKFSTPKDGIVGEVTYEDGTKKELTQEEYDALEKQEGLFDVETGTQPVAETVPAEETQAQKTEKAKERNSLIDKALAILEPIASAREELTVEQLAEVSEVLGEDLAGELISDQISKAPDAVDLYNLLDDNKVKIDDTQVTEQERVGTEEQGRQEDTGQVQEPEVSQEEGAADTVLQEQEKVESITDEELDAIDRKLSQEGAVRGVISGRSRKRKVIRSVRNGIKAISNVLPNTSVKVYETQEEYEAATGRKGAGSFDPETNTISINLSSATERAMAHEVFHAFIVNNLPNQKAATELTKKLYEQLRKAEIGNVKLIDKLESFADMYRLYEPTLVENPTDALYATVPGLDKNGNEITKNLSKEEYDAYMEMSEENEGILNEEKISEYVGIIAENYNSLTAKGKRAVKEFVESLLRIITGEYPSTAEFLPSQVSGNEVVDMLRTIGEKVATGKEIIPEDIKSIQTFEGGETVSDPISSIRESRVGAFELNYIENDKLDNFIKDGLVRTPEDLTEFDGMTGVATYPDDMFSGIMSIDGKEMFEAGGGIFFVLKYGDVWAFGLGSDPVKTRKKLNSVVAEMNRKLEENGGRLLIPLVKGRDEKLFSSPSGAKGSVMIAEKLLEKGLISKSDFRNAAFSAIKQVEEKIKKKEKGKAKKKKKTSENLSISGSSDQMISQFNNFFLDKTSSTFELRGDVAKGVWEKLASLKSFKENNTLISEFLGVKDNVTLNASKSGKGMYVVDAVANVMMEPILKGLPQHYVYAVIEVNSPVEIKEDSHESYPLHLVTKDGKSKPILHLPKKRISVDESLHVISSGNPARAAAQTTAYVKFGPRDQKAKQDTQASKSQPFAKRDQKNAPLFSGKNRNIIKLASDYVKSKGLPSLQDTEIRRLNTEYSKAMADAYEAAKDRPLDEDVQRAYKALAEESKEQFEVLKKAGYVVELWDGSNEPYNSSTEMLADLRDNKHLYIFSTEEGFGETGITPEQRKENPMLADSGYKDANGNRLLLNDLFRFVHDAFGHGKLGNSFGPIGEENAWYVHSQMFSPDARRAMTSETRGQNSWVNFGPHLRNKDGSLPKKGDKNYVPLSQRDFAPQKNFLFPDEYVFDRPNTQGRFEGRDQKVKVDKSTIKKNVVDAVDFIKNAALKIEDGVTLNIDGTRYDGGGLVVPISSMNVEQGTLKPSTVAEFVDMNKGKLSNDTFKLGLYKFPKESTVSIDLSVIVPNENRKLALSVGKKLNQESLFDLDTGENIKTGGTGQNTVELTDEQAAELATSLSENKEPKFLAREQKTKEKKRGFLDRNIEKLKFVSNLSESVFENPESFYEPQVLAEIKENAKYMSDSELIEAMSLDGLNSIMNISGSTNTNMAVLAAAELINRKVAAGQSIDSVAMQLNKMGTAIGQLMRQFGELKKSTPAGYMLAVERLADRNNIKLKESDKNKISRLVQAKTELINDLNEATNKRLDPNLSLDEQKSLDKKIKEISKNLYKIDAELNRFVQTKIPLKTTDVLVQIMQGNLLTTASLAVNILSNISQLSITAPVKLFGSAFDSLREFFIGGERTTSFSIPAYLYGAKSFVKTLPDAARILFWKGPRDDFNEMLKGEVNNGLLGLRAWMVLMSKGGIPEPAKMSGFDKMLSIISKKAGEKKLGAKANLALNLMIQGTFGVTADWMFRALQAGDVIFKRPYRDMTLYEMAKRRGLSKDRLETMLKYPSKKDLQMAEEIAKEGTFQEDSALAMSSKLITDAMTKAAESIGGKVFARNLAKILARSQFPYVKTPANIASYTFKMNVPVIAFLASMNYLRNGDNRKAALNFGIGVTGSMISTVAISLVANGLIQSMGDEDDPKERALKYASFPPGTINKSALKRVLDYIKEGYDKGGSSEMGERLRQFYTGEIPDEITMVRSGEDEFMSYLKIGIPGFVMGVYAMEDKDTAKQKAVNPAKENLIESMMGGTLKLPQSIKFISQQSFLQGTSALLNALTGSEYETEKWLTNTFRAVSSIPLPNQLASIARSQRDYLPDYRDENLSVQFKNVMSDKIFFLRKETPADQIRVDLWGRKIAQTPEGADPYMYHLGLDPMRNTKASDDKVSFEIYELYKKTGDSRVIPSMVDDNFLYTYKGEKRRFNMNVEQTNRLQGIVGSIRLIKAYELISSRKWEMMDDEQKIDKLDSIYRDAAKHRMVEKEKKIIAYDIARNVSGQEE